MELRRLRYFVAVADELHFGRAAERLGLCQPPLSQQIRKLEEEVGARLLRRGRGRTGVQLTEAGQALLPEARRILAHVDQTIRSTQCAGRGEVGTLHVGFIGSASCNVLPGILKTFRARFPDVTLALHEQPTEDQIQALRAARIDVGLLRPPAPDPSIRTEPIFRERLVLALPTSHRLAGRRRVPLRALAGELFVLLPRRLGPSLYDQIVLTCRRAGFSPRVGQEAVEMHTIVSLVAAEMGVALLPASFRNVRRQGVVYVEPREATAQVETALAWRRDDPSPVLARFVEVVRELAGLRSGATITGAPPGRGAAGSTAVPDPSGSRETSQSPRATRA
jgi:DNA-binding transcriptional LysR family regulator